MYMYTVFSINTHREHLGDASLASPEHLSAAIDELVAYCEAQQAEGDIHDQAVVGVHCEAHEARVQCAIATVGSLCHGSRVGRSSISQSRRSFDDYEREACDLLHRQNA